MYVAVGNSLHAIVYNKLICSTEFSKAPSWISDPLTYLQLTVITPAECPHINILGRCLNFVPIASVEQEIYHAFKFFTFF